MNVDIVGEDEVTQAIIERLLIEFRPDIEINMRLPARGGQIKKFAPQYNKTGNYVFLLTDLDNYDCPPSLIGDWFGKEIIQNTMLFRIAQEEAETWLMADRKGFAQWLSVDITDIPEPKIIDKKKSISEIIFPMKPSLYMMLEIASKSTDEDLKDKLTPKKLAGKGPAYNSAMRFFIDKKWNVNNAAKNSYSLSKAIERLKQFGL